MEDLNGDDDPRRKDEEKSAEYQALLKLVRTINAKKITIFDDNEERALKRVAAIYMALDTIGTMATFVKNMLIALGVIIGAYTAFKMGFLDWLKPPLK